VKASARPPAKLMELRAGVSMGTGSPGTERSSIGQSVWGQCGDVCLLRGDCWQRHDEANRETEKWLEREQAIPCDHLWLGITSGLHKRKNSRPYYLHMVSRETLLVLKVALGLTLGQSMLLIWVLITKITGEFILVVDNGNFQYCSGFEDPCAMTGRRRGVFKVCHSLAAIIPPNPGQRRGDASSV
jgi:hypothetical protein